MATTTVSVLTIATDEIAVLLTGDCRGEAHEMVNQMPDGEIAVTLSGAGEQMARNRREAHRAIEELWNA